MATAVDDDGAGATPSPHLRELRQRNRALRIELGSLKAELKSAGQRRAAPAASKAAGGASDVGPTRRNFDAEKARILAGLQSDCADNSKKGDVDEPIKAMLSFLNGLPSFVSTSSCSGRVAVFCEGSGGAKHSGHWAYVTHSAVGNPAELVGAVRGASAEWAAVSLKVEPLVLHVSCASLADAQRFIRVALACGYKNSGMLVGKRVMVAVRSTLRLDVPVAMDGDLLVSDEYLCRLARLADDKMAENQRRTATLFGALRAEFASQG